MLCLYRLCLREARDSQACSVEATLRTAAERPGRDRSSLLGLSTGLQVQASECSECLSGLTQRQYPFGPVVELSLRIPSLNSLQTDRRDLTSWRCS